MDALPLIKLVNPSTYHAALAQVIAGLASSAMLATALGWTPILPGKPDEKKSREEGESKEKKKKKEIITREAGRDHGANHTITTTTKVKLKKA